MDLMNLFAKRYIPPLKGEQRLRALEKQVAAQGEALYVLLNRMDKRLETLEKRVQGIATEAEADS